MEPPPGAGSRPPSSRRGSRTATALVVIGTTVLLLAPVVLFLGFAWIQDHHYGDGTGDLGTPFAWMFLDLLAGAALIAVGTSLARSAEPRPPGPG